MPTISILSNFPSIKSESESSIQNDIPVTFGSVGRSVINIDDNNNPITRSELILILIFLKFPIEVGVYISEKGTHHLLDVFTLTNPKFTVYGDPSNGFLCKYWKSDFYNTMPLGDAIREGILELSISNTRTDWAEVTKAVFNAYGMKIYYSDSMVSMRAGMKIKGADIAETEFENSPLEAGMNDAIEIYTTRKLSVTSTKFAMEFGL